MICHWALDIIETIEKKSEEKTMSLQDKMEQILKNIHLLFSASKPYDEAGEWIIVEKGKVFEQLEQLNLAVYEMMDTYEMTNQKHQLAQRRCEKRGEELIQKASRHADDIYAASIMYTDDAINRICHIMEDANDSVRKIFRNLNNEMDRERERVRHNQLELTSQLQDFADTNKYIKLIEEINKKLERERLEEAKAQKEKRIQNEGKSYSSVQPEIRVNEEYFQRMERNYDLTPLEVNARKEEEESLARVTGKDFAESLRRRAAKSREESKQSLEIEDMSNTISIPTVPRTETYEEIASEEGFADTMRPGTDEETSPDSVEDILQSEEFAAALQREALMDDGLLPGEEEANPIAEAEIRVDLDAEYFKWKEEAGMEEEAASSKKKARRSLFSRRS